MGRTGKRNPRLGEDFLVWADADNIIKIILNTYKFVEEHISPDAPARKEHIGYIIDRVGFEEYKKVGLGRSIFSIDTQMTCANCGFVIYNDTLSCVQWCKYARKCVGDEMYEHMMEITGREHQNRRISTQGRRHRLPSAEH